MNFPFEPRVICSLVSGSHLYGISTPESDVDLRGVIVPPPEYWYGMEHFEQYEPEGVDTVYHDLRKFLKLSAAGNPMFLEMWWTPTPDRSSVDKYRQSIWEKIKKELWHLVLSKKLIKPHLGMAQAHLARIEMPGKRAGQKGLKAIKKYGYNTKDASHVIRVLHQAQELLNNQKLTFPRPEVEMLSGIRKGAYSLEAIRVMEASLTEAVRNAHRESTLPEHPDLVGINRWLVANVPDILRILDLTT
jgi:uncharacterized protein